MTKSKTKEMEEYKDLQKLLNGCEGLTPNTLALALAYLLEKLKAMCGDEQQTLIDGRKSGTPALVQEYATSAQIARIVGADKASVWRQLKQLESAGAVEVICFNPSDKGVAYPRYKLADVIGAFQSNAKALKVKGDVQ